MKKLFTLTFVFLFGIGFSNAEKTEDDRRYRNYTENFIFNLEGIEFAVFPDGQFDFNYLQDRNGVNVYVNTGNVNLSFNTGYDYNRFVQYDTYGAVIQIEQIPIFYDSYGRVIQIGDVNVFYNNGYINRIGSLNVYYSRPGIINYHTGFINTYNRGYVYQPWHGYYSIPVVSNCIVYNNPYRTSYFPIRYSWNYHRLHWNSATYYNGFYAGVNARRNFYRPSDRVSYRSFERGRRDARGRAVAINSSSVRNRQAIVSGRSQVSRNDRGRSVVSTNRNSGRTNRTVSTRSNTNNGRSSTISSSRSNRSVTTPTTSRSTTRSTNATVGIRTTSNPAATRSTSTNRSTRATSIPSRTTNRATTSRSSVSRNATTTRSTPSTRTTVGSRNTTTRNTQVRSSRTSSNNSRSSTTTNSRTTSKRR